MVEPRHVARDGAVVASVSARELERDELRDARLEVAAQRVLVQVQAPALQVVLERGANQRWN